MSDAVQYLTSQEGDRFGVLLLETYHRLTQVSASDPEFLTSLSLGELQALANSKTAPAEQVQLNELLTLNAETQSEDATAKLDRLLTQIDHLNTLRTRAKYTLDQHHRASA